MLLAAAALAVLGPPQLVGAAMLATDVTNSFLDVEFALALGCGIAVAFVLGIPVTAAAIVVARRLSA